MLIYCVVSVQKVAGVTVQILVTTAGKQFFVDVCWLYCRHHHLKTFELVFFLLYFRTLILLHFLRRDFSSSLGAIAIVECVLG